MTVLYSCIVPEGLIFAADTMLTTKEGTRRRFYDSKEPKVFRVQGLGDHPDGGLIGYFGNAMVGNQSMAVWLGEILPAFAANPDTAAFPQFLIDRLKGAATAAQLQSVQGFHVGAFERRQGYRVPVFWFIRNAEANPATASYKPFPGWEFRWDEQLLARDYQALPPSGVRPNVVEHVKRLGTPAWYRNGDLWAFAAAGNAIDLAALAMSQATGQGYRYPRSLNRWTELAKTYVRTASALAQIYYRAGTPSIGGRAVALNLPWD